MLFSNSKFSNTKLRLVLFYLTFAEKRYLSGSDTCLFSTQERTAEIGTFLMETLWWIVKKGGEDYSFNINIAFLNLFKNLHFLLYIQHKYISQILPLSQSIIFKCNWSQFRNTKFLYLCSLKSVQIFTKRWIKSLICTYYLLRDIKYLILSIMIRTYTQTAVLKSCWWFHDPQSIPQSIIYKVNYSFMT